ncbi:MAG: response regulator [Nostocales cyanobacterium 94392]|nr:response regulator [Nostocales cyanobacterium 94392]
MSEILIVEDENRLAAFLQKGLRKNGYTIVIAEDGEQAIKIALTQQFDLMVLDIGLPFKDGFTVLQELRTQGRKLPVIVITARSDDQDKVKAFAFGANDYMTKPFRFQDLLLSVKKNLLQVKS